MGDGNLNRSVFSNVRLAREQLETHLFNDANKVSKISIKFILSKWLALEFRLQEKILEKEKLQIVHNECANRSKVTYAEVDSKLTPKVSLEGTSMSEQFKKPQTKKEKYEVVIIKPEKENDRRSNDVIKTVVTEVLKDEKNKFKVRNIGQLRNKDVVMEIESKTDVKIIKEVKFADVGLRTDEPKKLDPCVIIYDVEKYDKAQVWKEDFVNKNFNDKSEQEINELKEKVNIRYCFKNSSCVNWQLSSKDFQNVLSKGKVFMSWQIYNVREYINVVHCYKYPAYGHMLKNCIVPKKVCTYCGGMDYSKDDCTRKEKPICVNCVHFKRKDVDHFVRNRSCSEYMRQAELYKRALRI